MWYYDMASMEFGWVILLRHHLGRLWDRVGGVEGIIFLAGMILDSELWR